MMSNQPNLPMDNSTFLDRVQGREERMMLDICRDVDFD
jgi:hypothetical protein